jgi:aspartyl-tRNA(Asn)/glutamyl-tRNA(Gln) amidotransferase subunit A
MSAELRTIAELAPAIEQRTTSSEELTRECLARIEHRNPTLNAFITVFAEQAIEDARAADRDIASGRYRGPLHGIPVSLKDLIDVAGAPTTAGSRVRAQHVAARDAEVTGRLRAAGAIVIGKTNLHEFAFGTTSEDSAFGPVRHPLDPGRSPGGSSGGSGAAVADGMSYASLGTDTGGSIRIPAAACGVVGLKPGFGELPVDGVVPLSASLDHVGPLCRSVEDAAIVYDVLRGAAPQRREPWNLRGTRFGIPRPYFLALLDPHVASAFESACARLADAGAEIEDVDIPHAGDIAAIYLHIVLAEAAAYHAKMLDSRGDDYTPAVRIRLELGRYILAEDYVRALSGRRLLTREVDAALRGRAALLLPALAMPAPKLGTTTVRLGGTEEPIRNAMLRLTQAFNVTGHPAIAVPCGRTAIDGLPLGAQLVGARGDTGTLLRVAAAAQPYLGPGMSR